MVKYSGFHIHNILGFFRRTNGLQCSQGSCIINIVINDSQKQNSEIKHNKKRIQISTVNFVVTEE